MRPARSFSDTFAKKVEVMRILSGSSVRSLAVQMLTSFMVLAGHCIAAAFAGDVDTVEYEW